MTKSPRLRSNRPGLNPDATRAGTAAHPQDQRHRAGELLAVAEAAAEHEVHERHARRGRALAVRRAGLDALEDRLA
jgi:hypothetical protein